MKNLIFSLIICLVLFGHFGISSLLAQSDANNNDAEGQSYVVQVNDSLWKVAEKYWGDGQFYSVIVEATNTMAAKDTSFSSISDPNLIIPGQKLWISEGEIEQSIAQEETTMVTVTPSVAETSVPIAAPTVTAITPPTSVPVSSSGSPTGHIAFSFWNNSGGRCTYEINVVNVSACLQGAEQCQSSRRIFPLNNVSEPALSPDGERLAFRSWGEPLSADSPYLNCAPAHPYRHIGNSTLDGTEFVSTGGFWEDSHPDWSADGNRVIFNTDRQSDGVIHIRAIDKYGNNEENMLIAGQHPSWAPDNTRFVYRGCDLSGNQCGLWVGIGVEVKTWERGNNMLGPVVLADQVAHPDWSPTREEIVYQRVENGSWNLWLVNADGSNDHALTTNQALEGLPSWSPDGNWIAYVHFDGQNWAIRIINRNGTDDRHIFTYDGGQYTLPTPHEPYEVRDWIDEQISWGQ